MKILRHTVFNLVGLGAPLLVAVGTIPVLIDELGPARFGLLTLIWAVVSYFGLFDLGLGRALTQQLAIAFANDEHEKIGPLVATATVLMGLLGALAALLMAAAASWGVGLIHDVPDRQEAVYAVDAMALAMPFIVLTSGFRGILEARDAFGIINLIRLPMGVFTFLGPLAVVLYAQPARLDYIAWVLVAGRVIACGVHGYYAWRTLPRQHSPLVWQTALVSPLCTSGGWLTVSNVISPIMSYLDRFVLGAVVSASAVAYYATPQELVLKLAIVPIALTAVLFPALSASINNRQDSTILLVKKAMFWLFVTILPVTVAITLFAEKLLSSWISEDFSNQSAMLLQILSIAMFVGSMAQIPFTVIQSAGRSKITALIHLVEVPLFLLLLWLLTSRFGALGAAYAWLFRILVDTILMTIGSMVVLELPLFKMLSIRVLSAGIFSVFCFGGGLLPVGMARVLWMLSVIFMVSAILVFTQRRWFLQALRNV
jgi:O-antigen/teichoic acid export membrane protein